MQLNRAQLPQTCVLHRKRACCNGSLHRKPARSKEHTAPTEMHAASEACMLRQKPSAEACIGSMHVRKNCCFCSTGASLPHTACTRTHASHAQHTHVHMMHATACWKALGACCVPHDDSSVWYTLCVLQPDMHRDSSPVFGSAGALHYLHATHECSRSRYIRQAVRYGFPSEPSSHMSSAVCAVQFACSFRPCVCVTLTLHSTMRFCMEQCDALYVSCLMSACPVVTTLHLASRQNGACR